MNISYLASATQGICVGADLLEKGADHMDFSDCILVIDYFCGDLKVYEDEESKH